MTEHEGVSAAELSDQLQEFLNAEVLRWGTTVPVRPDHYTPWHWPPHSQSYDYHLVPSDWTGRATLHAAGLDWPVEVAESEFGVFGRSPDLRCDARGKNESEMLLALGERAKPLLERWAKVADALGREGLADGSIRLFSPAQKLRLLYARDRAISRDAQSELEVGGYGKLLGASMLVVLRDERHPMRRQAQWAVLDMLEDLPTYFATEPEREEAVDAMVDLIARAKDDYARAIFKAGVVLGGHVCTPYAAEAVLGLFGSPSRIARRSVYHTVFHLAEWLPDYRERILDALGRAAEEDTEQALRVFAASLQGDIRAENVEHMEEPRFEDEA